MPNKQIQSNEIPSQALSFINIKTGQDSHTFILPGILTGLHSELIRFNYASFAKRVICLKES